MNQKVKNVLGDLILHSVKDVKAYAYWSHSFGHGLKVEVLALENPSKYSRNLELELNGAAMVCAALAKSELGTQWEFVEVQYSVEYGKMSPQSRMIVGVAEVMIQREIMMTLIKKRTAASEYAHYWKFIRGNKDQPDSNELLRW